MATPGHILMILATWITQSLFAIGSGGIFGTGLDRGILYTPCTFGFIFSYLWLGLLELCILFMMLAYKA